MRTPFTGKGYSSDTQQMVAQRCFNSQISSTSSQHATIVMDQAISQRDLANIIRYYSDIKGKYEMFSASAKASYMRSIEEKLYTISLNYYNIMSRQVNLDIDGYREAALTPFGASVYNDNPNLFRLSCGDEYITSYSEGALLMVNLYLELYDYNSKSTFEAEAQGSYGNLFAASAKIEQIVNKHQLSGRVSLKAYQEGGDPAMLAGILGQPDSDGNYYILSCDFASLANCKNAANAVLDYARNSFSSQVSFTTGDGLATFGDSFFESNSIVSIGLTESGPAATGIILLNRLKFANEFVKYKSYQAQLENLNYKYGDILTTNSNLRNDLLVLASKVRDNLNGINTNAIKCYDGLFRPEDCIDVETVIQPINDNELLLVDKTLECEYYSQGFQRLLENYPVPWNVSSGLYNSLVRIKDMNLENCNKLATINGNPNGYATAAFTNITRNVYEPVNGVKYKYQVYNDHTQPGGYAYRYSDNAQTGLRATDPKVINIVATLDPGVSYRVSHVYTSDWRGNPINVVFTSNSASGGTYVGSTYMSWPRGSESYSSTMSAPISEFWPSYYDPFIIYNDDVIAVGFDYQVNCNMGQTCLSSPIPFGGMTYNVATIKISRLPEHGQLKVLSTNSNVVLNQTYNLNEIVYVPSLTDSRSQIYYSGFSSDGEQTTTSIINVNTVYSPPNSSINFTGSNTPQTLTYIEDNALDINNIRVNSNASIVSVNLIISDRNAGTLTIPSSGTTHSSFSQQTGTWSVSGSVSDVNAILSAIRFNPSGNYNSNFSISVVLNDQYNSPIINTININGTPVNDAPVLSGSSVNLSYIEGRAPVTIDNTIAITDIDSPLLSGATVSITNNFAPEEDILQFANQNGIIGSYNSDTGILTLSGSASVANYQAALRSVKYQDTSSNPSTAPRTITFAVNDGSFDSNILSKAINVTPVSDAPSLSSTSSSANYTEKQAPVFVDNSIAITDVDSTQLSGATISITNNFAPEEDILQFTNQNGIIGSYNSDTGILTLSGSASVASYQAALRSVKYQDTSSNPSTAQRTITFAVNDGSFDSNILSKAINVVPVNDAPSLSSTPNSANYTEKQAPVFVDNTITITDVDSPQLSGATISITNNFVQGEDILQFTNQNGITGSYNSDTGILTLSGSASVAKYQAALRSVKYQDTSSNPSTAPRTITFSVNDGNDDSNEVATLINIAKDDSGGGISLDTILGAVLGTIGGLVLVAAAGATLYHCKKSGTFCYKNHGAVHPGEVVMGTVVGWQTKSVEGASFPLSQNEGGVEADVYYDRTTELHSNEENTWPEE